MEASKTIFLFNDDVRAVKAVYDPDKPEEAKVFKTMIPDLKVDDFVLVKADYRWGMTTCKVTEIDIEPDLDSQKKMNWVIMRLDLTEHEKLVEYEEKALAQISKANKKKKRRELADTVLADVNGELDEIPIYKGPAALEHKD